MGEPILLAERCAFVDVFNGFVKVSKLIVCSDNSKESLYVCRVDFQDVFAVINHELEIALGLMAKRTVKQDY